MSVCGFNAKMIDGIVVFAQGLFEATIVRAKENGVSIEGAFKQEVRDIRLFLEALENNSTLSDQNTCIRSCG
jgi:hypothetical protein